MSCVCGFVGDDGIINFGGDDTGAKLRRFGNSSGDDDDPAGDIIAGLYFLKFGGETGVVSAGRAGV